MFERYTEQSRRALFYARFAASEFGSTAIDTEHLLLGLLREPRTVASAILQRTQVSIDDVRRDLERRLTSTTPSLPMSVEIPFTTSARQALHDAAAEADRLHHATIEIEHLLLALLRDETTGAGATLAAHGLHLDAARTLAEELGGADPDADALTHPPG